MNRQEALDLTATEWWKDVSKRDIAAFQLFEDRLCCPWSVFQDAVQEALGRPVWTHEFAGRGLQKEFLGERPAPTFDEIMDLIPEEKRLVIQVPEAPSPERN